MKIVCQLIGVTILLILSAAGAVIGGIGFATSGRPILALACALAGVGLIVACVRGLIGLNRRWFEEYGRRFQDDSELIARWSVPAKDWQALADYERQAAAEGAPAVAAVVGVIVAFMGVLATWGISPAAALPVGAVAGLVTAGLALIYERSAGGKKPYFRAIDDVENEVKLREDGIVIRGTVVPWGGWNGRLDSIECEQLDGLNFHVLTVVVTQPAGETTVTRVHHVPLPSGAESLRDLAKSHAERLRLDQRLDSLAEVAA